MSPEPRLGAQILSDNNAAQNRLLVTGGVGLVFGIACALLIVVGIVRMLNEKVAPSVGAWIETHS